MGYEADEMRTMIFEIVIPDWANYIATDSGGECFAYDNEPEEGALIWIPNCGRCEQIALCEPPKNWKRELYTVK